MVRVIIHKMIFTKILFVIHNFNYSFDKSCTLSLIAAFLFGLFLRFLLHFAIAKSLSLAHFTMLGLSLACSIAYRPNQPHKTTYSSSRVSNSFNAVGDIYIPGFYTGQTLLKKI